MNKKDLLKKIGSMQQVAFIRPIKFLEGRAGNLKGFDIKNGNLRFQVISDKCLDISDFSYKGININFIAKQGLIGRMDYDTHGEEGTRSLMGGLLFTCGLENTCIPGKVQERYFPMHGRIRSTPAEHVGATAQWEKGNYCIRVTGKMREAELFGKNLTLERTIETIYGSRSVKITDIIENESFQEEPMMILYHFNIGYPLLDEGARVVLPSKEVMPRDKEAEKDDELWNLMEAPMENEAERVYLHNLAGDRNGNTFVCLMNEKIGLGIKIEFNKRYLPKFVQWKSLNAGDYVMGLEPTNSGVYGLPGEGEAVHKIKPFEQEKIELILTIIEGKDELEKIKEEAKAY
jgi:hypothetical protein